MKKFTPMISAFIPVIISLVVFDNVIFTNKNLRINFEKTAYSKTYIHIRNVFAEELKPLNSISKPQKSELIRNVTFKSKPISKEIASNWKSSTLLQ
jgi:hypothetical protein